MTLNPTPTGLRIRPAVAAFGLAGLALFAGAMPAWAAEGGSGNPWMDLLWKAINVFVLLALLHIFARKPLLNMFRGAAERTKDALQGQRLAAEQAEKELQEQKQRIDGLHAELERLVVEARQEAADERARLIADAQAQADRIREQTKQQVEQEFSKASIELRRQLADETVRLAEKLLADRMDDKARERLVDSTIDQLGSHS